MQNDVLLQMTGICKQFPGVRALDGVSLTCACAHGRKWCGKIYAHEMPVWHV